MATIDGDSEGGPTSREVALRRGSAASSLLRRAAQMARYDAMPAANLPGFLRPKRIADDQEGGRMAVFLRLTFIFVFIVPAALISIYFGLLASSQYASELRFAVRSGDKSALERLSGPGAMSALSQAQDTLIVTDDIKSRPMVETLDSELNLRAMYSRPEIDLVSSFDPDASIEELVKFWNGHVKVSIDSSSGLVYVQVRAFTPGDALAIAKAVTSHSEALVNDMSKRASADLVKDTEAELKRAEERLKETRAALQELRNKEGTLDADTEASGLATLLASLKTERANVAGQIAALASRISSSAPQIKPLQARLAALDAQIAQIEREMTGGKGGDGADVSTSLTRFDALKLDNAVAERRYAAAVQALEAARLSAERRKVYINSFVEPSLAQDPNWPPRFWYVFGSIIAFFSLWVMLAAAVKLTRTRMV